MSILWNEYQPKIPFLTRFICSNCMLDIEMMSKLKVRWGKKESRTALHILYKAWDSKLQCACDASCATCHTNSWCGQSPMTISKSNPAPAQDIAMSDTTAQTCNGPWAWWPYHSENSICHRRVEAATFQVERSRGIVVDLSYDVLAKFSLFVEATPSFEIQYQHHLDLVLAWSCMIRDENVSPTFGLGPQYILVSSLRASPAENSQRRLGLKAPVSTLY